MSRLAFRVVAVAGVIALLGVGSYADRRWRLEELQWPAR